MGKEYSTRNKRNTLLAAVASNRQLFISIGHTDAHTHHLMPDGTLHLHLFNKEWAAIFF